MKLSEEPVTEPAFTEIELHTHHLRQLAQHLSDVVHPDRFAMSQFAVAPTRLPLDQPVRLPSLNACGTTACALGHATDVWPDKFRLIARYAAPGATTCCLQYNHGALDGWGALGHDGFAVQDWFGLTEHEAAYAFGPHRERTPAEEAAILESFANSRYELRHTVPVTETT
jgi:hypothetical protein